jgi:hypothetical protein
MGTVMKKLILSTALAASAALAFTGAANAAVNVTVNPTVSDYATDVAAVPDSQVLWDFDTIFAPGYSYSPVSATASGNVTNVTKQPTGDTTIYGTVNPTDSPAVFTTTSQGLSHFSMLVGSPDTFNRMVFLGLDGVTVLADLTGATGLFGSVSPVNGSDTAYRVTWDFGAQIGSVELYSNANADSYAYEFDRISGVVPEPASWAMMLIGFFGLGATLRSSRKLAPSIA